MIFSYNWLQNYFDKKLPKPEKMAELLTFHSFEVESIEKKGSDWALDIDVLPNRGHDCFSHLGIAKEIAVIFGLKMKMPQILAEENPAEKSKDLIMIEVKSAADCPRYSAKVIKGIEAGQSPKWMQEHLKTCGLKPINNIVDITNYVMLETGQPLHAFDLDKINGKIIVRRAKAGESMKALDDKPYKLDKNVLVIADNQKPIAIAGIKGGEETGIDKKTENIVIEAANFNPVLIRRASQQLKLRTDASARFEQGIDPNLIDLAQKRTAYLIEQLVNGKPAQGLADFYPKKTASKKIKLNLDYLNSMLGVSMPKSKVLSILKSLDFQCFEVSPQNIEVRVPSIRLDIGIEEDLIEEIGRIYGFNNITAQFPKASLAPGKENPKIIFEQKLKDSFVKLGFSEAYNSSFIGEEEKQEFDYQEKDLLEIANPISSLNKYLRPSLLPHLIKNISDNFRFFDRVKLFEIGNVFSNNPKAIKEEKIIAAVWANKNSSQDDFYCFRGAIEKIIEEFGIKGVNYTLSQPTKGVFFFEMNFNSAFNKRKLVKEYQKIPNYPPILRDLALLVPKGTSYREIENVINKAGSNLLRELELFEVYSGKGVPAGKENFAFHLIYQSNEKTLSANEVDKIHQIIIKSLEKKQGWQVRK